jgi:histidinol-phosphate aminotransferase
MPVIPMRADTRAGAGLSFHGDSELAAGLVDMAVNVRHGTPPPWLAERIRAAVAGIAAYPDPRAATEAVARRHARPPAEVLVTAGAAEAFTLIARAFRPRHAAVVHPQFTEPEAALLAAGHRPERVTLGGTFLLEPGAVPAGADLVMIGNPTNPTSVLHPAAAIMALARPGRLLVVDEAFADCVPGEPESLAGARGIPGLIVVRSLTKTWGLAGLRAGYVLAGAAQMTAMARVQPPWAVSSPALAAVAACCGPRAGAEAAAWAAQMSAERERLARALNGIPGVAVTPRARASFLLLNVAGGGSVRGESPAGRLSVRERLREAGFAVRRGDTFPGLGADWLRVAVRDRATNDRFAASLRRIMEARALEGHVMEGGKDANA